MSRHKLSLRKSMLGHLKRTLYLNRPDELKFNLFFNLRKRSSGARNGRWNTCLSKKIQVNPHSTPTPGVVNQSKSLIFYPITTLLHTLGKWKVNRRNSIFHFSTCRRYSESHRSRKVFGGPANCILIENKRSPIGFYSQETGAAVFRPMTS